MLYCIIAGPVWIGFWFIGAFRNSVTTWLFKESFIGQRFKNKKL